MARGSAGGITNFGTLRLTGMRVTNNHANLVGAGAGIFSAGPLEMSGNRHGGRRWRGRLCRGRRDVDPDGKPDRAEHAEHLRRCGELLISRRYPCGRSDYASGHRPSCGSAGRSG
jgi:hypothetical protein